MVTENERLGMSYDDFRKLILQKQRIEVISHYVESPLLLGGGSREFWINPILQPVLPFGPTGKPVPGGANVDLAGVPKYPAATVRGQRDILFGIDTRNVTYDEVTVEGEEVVPPSDAFTWVQRGAFDVCAVGDVDIVLATVIAGEIWEVCINHISVIPDNQVAPVCLHYLPAVSAGALRGSTYVGFLNFRHDLIANICTGELSASFPLGFRYGNDEDCDIYLRIQNGAGVEGVSVDYGLRRVA